MMYRVILSVFLMLLVYPVAFMASVAIDAAFGNLEFFDRWLYDSKQRLLLTILGDWIRAALWIIPLVLSGVLVLRYMPGLLRLSVFLIALGLIPLAVLWETIPQLPGLVVAFSLMAALMLTWRSV